MKDAYCNFWRKFYRKDIVDAVRFEDYKVGEDTLFMMKCLIRSHKMVSIPLVGYGYRMRAGSISHLPFSLELCLAHPRLMSEFLALAESNREKIGRDLLRLWLNNATETFQGIISKLPKSDARIAWRTWKEYALAWRDNRAIIGFQSFRLKLFSTIPLRITSWLLFYLPWKLKTLGLRRRK